MGRVLSRKNGPNSESKLRYMFTPIRSKQVLEFISAGEVQRISTTPLRNPDETDMFKGGSGRAGYFCSKT
jgi:hypothetical protein